MVFLFLCEFGSKNFSFQAEDAKVKVAFETLMKFIANVATRPEEEKFRKIRMSNPAFQVSHLLPCSFLDRRNFLIYNVVLLSESGWQFN